MSIHPTARASFFESGLASESGLAEKELVRINLAAGDLQRYARGKNEI